MFQQIIVPIERVRSIFYGQPVHLQPLKLTEVIKAIELRYKLLSIQVKRWIRPVDNSLVEYLYEVFSGKIRFIMDAITTIVTNLPEGVTGTLSTEVAKELLKELTHQNVQNVLTDTEHNVLQIAIKQ